MTNQAEQRTLYLRAEAHGFGDACVTSVISENSRDLPVRLVHSCQGEMAAFVRMLGQEVVQMPDNECVDTFEAYSAYEIQTQGGRVPRVWSRALALGIYLDHLRPEDLVMPKAVISDRAKDWAKATCDEMRAFGECKAVALWPQTVYACREWPVGYWHDLAWGLRQRGIGARFFLGKDEPRWHNTPGYVFGMGWEYWAALMLEADVNVAISSGPASLAAILRACIIVLEGPTKPTIWAHTPWVEIMQVGKDAVDCVGCHFGTPFRGACDFGCFALQALNPAQVLARVLEKLGVESRQVERSGEPSAPLRLWHWSSLGSGALDSRTRALARPGCEGSD
ncbi:MAG: hypothetical protein EBR82_18935 [Caulobacteraceae bacterium]|nr:hypothetical protein [Caulobacteraceae bacterium]